MACKVPGTQARRISVRQASAQDAAASVAIYRPYVKDKAISSDIEVPTVDEMAALRWSTQTGVCVDADNHRAGGGRQLYHATTAPTRRARLPGRPSPASLNPTRPVRAFIDRSDSTNQRIPASRMEAGQLARRRMDATRAARRCRPRRSAPPDHVIRRGRARPLRKRQGVGPPGRSGSKWICGQRRSARVPRP